MSPRLRRLYLKVRRSPIGQCVSPSVPYCRRVAITLSKWDAAESAGFVRLRAEDDEHYRPGPDNCDCGDPRCSAITGPAYGSIGEYRTDPDSEEWQHGDSCWGHTGYSDVLDWRENIYIVDIMDETLRAFAAARKASILTAPHPAG